MAYMSSSKRTIRGKEHGPFGYDGLPVFCVYCHSPALAFAHMSSTCWFECTACGAESPRKETRKEALAAVAKVSPAHVLKSTEEAELYELDPAIMASRSRPIAAAIRDELKAARPDLGLDWVYPVLRDILTLNGACWTTEAERQKLGFPSRKLVDWKTDHQYELQRHQRRQVYV